MHKVFAGSAVVLFASTIVMMQFDQDREWRYYQAEAENLRYEQLQRDRTQLETGDYLAELDDLQKKAAAAEAEVESRKADVDRIDAEIQKFNGEVLKLEREVKFKNAAVGVERADFDIDVRDAASDAQLAQQQELFQTESEEARAMVLKLEDLKAQRQALINEKAAITAAHDAALAALAKHQQDVQRVQEQMTLLRPAESGEWFAGWKRDIKRWPIINGFNPEIRIIQDWIPDLKQQLGMASVARFDRCRSCHVHIERFGAGNLPNFPVGELEDGKYPNPYCSHPSPELYLTDGSPHPLNKFGCTSCHEGDGSGTSFQTAEHTPSDPIQAEEWTEEHSWHSNHFWEYPQHSRQFIESGCLRCHHNVVELGVNEKFGPTAPKLYDGYSLIRDYGCFGCHEVNGFDGSRPIGPDLRLEPQTVAEAERIAADPNQVAGRMRKVGPSLRHIASKTTPEFVAYWTEMPSRFRPDTRMPQFFHLDNQEDALAELLQPVELAGIAAYLMDRSQPLETMQPVEGYQPDAERGKMLFSRRGCLACHSHDDPDFAGTRADFGPNLTKVHEKIRPGVDGFNWVYTWVRDPTRHHARTKMPNLFLEPEGEGDTYVDPAADIAAFLLSGGPREFPAVTLPGPYVGIGIDPGYNEEEAHALGLDSQQGVLVAEVLAGSPAERAVPADSSAKNSVVGELILAAGDVLLAWNGTPITGGEQFRSLESQSQPGDSVTLTRRRGGADTDVTVVVATPLQDLTRLYLRKQMTAEEVDASLKAGYLVKRQGTVGQDGTVEFSFTPTASEQIKGDEIELVHQDGDAEQLAADVAGERMLLYIGRRTISRYGCYGCHDIPGYEEARPIGTALQDWGRKDTSKLAPEHIEEYLLHHGEPDGSSTHERIEQIVNPAFAEEATHTDRMAAFFYENLMHHGRAGFFWQKVRAPRSYDYKKIETKGWDERLRMPKFPFKEDQIESVATFVLGLVADPPASKYLYQPTGPALARIEGERLIEKYNCTSCHMLDMPGFKYETDLRELIGVTRPELTKWLAANAEQLASGELTQESLAGGGGEGVEPAEYAAALATFFSNAAQLLDGQLEGVDDIKTGFAPYLAQVAMSGDSAAADAQAQLKNREAALSAWFDVYPETLLADPIPDTDVPASVPLAMKLKPPVRRGDVIDSSEGRAVVELHGLVFAEPDPAEEDPEFREYAFDLWENADIGGRYKLTGVNGRYVIPESSVRETVPGRGGDFTEWLIPKLTDELTAGDRNKARQSAPPPLYKEGRKVQTAWLFRFLKNPDQLRYTTVLRMPRFNMSDDEAQALANYFAARDRAEYPYQRIPQQEPPYLVDREQAFHALFDEPEQTYLGESWLTLNAPLCNKCHAVGGKPYQGTDPTKDIRGPNLDRVQQRFQADYLNLWLHKPSGILSYTSMPTNFPRNQEQYPELFDADQAWQTQGVIDALLNYYNLMERYGETAYVPPEGQTPPAEGEAPAAGDAATGAGTGGAR